MKTGPFYSPRDVVLVLCLSRNWHFHLSTNDIEVYSSRLTSSKRGRENKNQSTLANDFFSRHVPAHGFVALPPALTLSTRTHLSLTFPLHQDLQGHRTHYSHPPKRQHLKILNLLHPCSLRGVSSSESECQERKIQKAGTVAVANTSPLNRHRPPPLSLTSH